ncbi:MFS general substrate transporter [Auricularia subglabra TFB-10046 SS5]|nr:MFS general substrate transporter [Auricularia subglabra TFB-10046 SS5]
MRRDDGAQLPTPSLEAPPLAPASAPCEESYSVWSWGEKLVIVSLIGGAGLLSTMGGQVYFPAIPALASAFNVTIEEINLTVTSYLVLQGLSPMVFGPFADIMGRRSAYIVCLTILCGSCIGMAVMPQDAYWMLVLLRCLQSAGSASTISIGYGTITDIATPGERGVLIGVGSLGPVSDFDLGPALGGVLADHFGWRGIFWFLAAFAAIINITLILMLPETLRIIVGNGSLPPPPYLQPPLPLLTRRKTETSICSVSTTSSATFLRALVPTFLKDPAVVAILASNACAFALFQALLASISPILLKGYPFLGQTTIGLCFLPIGVGAALGSVLTGRIADAEFRRHGGTTAAHIATEFPLERARLRLVPFYVFCAAAAAVAFGWSAGRTSITAPLASNFIFGFSMIAIMNCHQTICLDLLPGQGASITAAMNLFRCLLGAGIVAAVDPLRRSLGDGWLFATLSGACVVLVLALNAFIRVYGPRMRRRR